MVKCYSKLVLWWTYLNLFHLFYKSDWNLKHLKWHKDTFAPERRSHKFHTSGTIKTQTVYSTKERSHAEGFMPLQRCQLNVPPGCHTLSGIAQPKPKQDHKGRRNDWQYETPPLATSSHNDNSKKCYCAMAAVLQHSPITTHFEEFR